jgi:hypothetical protein
MSEEQQFCLRWNNFQANITSQFEALRDEEDFVDVTLACDGQRLKAHKVVLSACSPYFKELFKVCNDNLTITVMVWYHTWYPNRLRPFLIYCVSPSGF